MTDDDRERFLVFVGHPIPGRQVDTSDADTDMAPALFFAATVFSFLPASAALTVNARFAEHVVATLIDQVGPDPIRVVMRDYPADLRVMLELLISGAAHDAEAVAAIRSAIDEGSVWNNPFVHLFTDLTGGGRPSVDERTSWDEVCRNALDRMGKWRECLLEYDETDQEAVDFLVEWLLANRFPGELALKWELATEEIRELHHRAMNQMATLFANWRPESKHRNEGLSGQPMTKGERALHRNGEPIEVALITAGRSDARRILRLADSPGKFYLFTRLGDRREELPGFAPLAMRDVSMHRVDQNLLGYDVTPVVTPYYSSDSAAWGVLTELPAGALPPGLFARRATDPAPLARFLDPVYRQQMFVLFCLTRVCGGMSMNMGADCRTPAFPYLGFIPADDGAEPRYPQWADFVQMGLRQPLLPEVLEPLLEIDPDEFAATLRHTVLPGLLAPPSEEEIADAVRLLEEIQDHGMVTGTAWPELEQLIPTAVTDLPPAAELRTMAAHWRSQVDYDYPLGALTAAELECYYGVTWELARDLQRAADIEGVVIGVRPMNPWATGQLRFGLTRPKPQSVKDKSSSNEDVALGRRPSLIGLVLAGKPVLPPVLPTDPAARNRLLTRYERRMSEWRAACARPDLTIDEHQVVRLEGESEPVGPDTDLYELLLPRT